MNDVLREQIQLNTKEVVVNVDNDHMKASIVLNGIGSDEAYTYEEIADKLSQAGVRTGINEARIREVILNKLYDIEIVVAEGKSAVNGTDGYYNFFFDSEYERDNKPTLREDGSVDYFNVKLFEKVNKDDKLAEYIEPTKGEFGYDVFGKLLVPKPGRPGTVLVRNPHCAERVQNHGTNSSGCTALFLRVALSKRVGESSTSKAN